VRDRKKTTITGTRARRGKRERQSQGTCGDNYCKQKQKKSFCGGNMNVYFGIYLVFRLSRRCQKGEGELLVWRHLWNGLETDTLGWMKCCKRGHVRVIIVM